MNCSGMWHCGGRRVGCWLVLPNASCLCKLPQCRGEQYSCSRCYHVLMLTMCILASSAGRADTVARPCALGTAEQGEWYCVCSQQVDVVFVVPTLFTDCRLHALATGCFQEHSTCHLWLHMQPVTLTRPAGRYSLMISYIANVTMTKPSIMMFSTNKSRSGSYQACTSKKDWLKLRESDHGMQDITVAMRHDRQATSTCLKGRDARKRPVD